MASAIWVRFLIRCKIRVFCFNLKSKSYYFIINYKIIIYFKYGLKVKVFA